MQPLQVTSSPRRGRYLLGLSAVVVCALVAVSVAWRTAREYALDRAVLLAPPHFTVSGDTSWVELSSYKEFEPSRLEQLPESIVRRVDSLLVAHVGREYRARLQFVNGQVVDHSHPVARNLIANMHWTVFGYRLGFLLPGPAEGVVSYIGYLTLDPTGLPISPIEFPPVRRFPDRGRFVTLQEARDTAAAHGVYAVGAALQYSAKDSALQFVVHGRYRDHGWSGTQPYVVVNAHNGRFVRKGKTDWIH